MTEKRKFYYVGDSCMDTYMNHAHGVKYTPFDCASCLEDQFLKLCKNFKEVDLTDYIKVPYQETAISKNKTYSWNYYNSKLNVDINKTFAYCYKLKNSDDRVEILYRHYHDTPENNGKVQQRISRFLTEFTDMTPVFLMIPVNGKTDRVCCQIQEFLDWDYPYKLFVDHKIRGFKTSKYVLNEYTGKIHHEQLVPLIDKKLKKLLI